MSSEKLQDRGWFRWNFDRASGREAVAYPHIPDAIAEFVADHETGSKAARWLQTEPTKAAADLVTWIYYEAKNERIEAFFAVRKTDQVDEKTSKRAADRQLKVAAEIVWLCKCSGAELHGKKIMARATFKAVELWEDAGYPPGTMVTVLLNPQGADTTKLRQKYPQWKTVSGSDLLLSRLKIRDKDTPPEAMDE